MGKAHTHALQLTLSEARRAAQKAVTHKYICVHVPNIVTYVRTYVHTYTHMYSMIYVRMYVVSQFTPTQDIHTYVYVYIRKYTGEASHSHHYIGMHIIMYLHRYVCSVQYNTLMADCVSKCTAN